MERDEETLDQLEEEARQKLGIKNIGPNMTTHEAGMLGGYMVKRLIERGEKAGSKQSMSGMENEE